MKTSIKLAVVVCVLCATGCVILVDQTTLDFGSEETTITFTLSVVGSAKWSIVSSESWITVSPSEGETTETVTVTVDRTGLDAGEYMAVLEIVSEYNIFNQSVAVIMTVDDEEGFYEETPFWMMPDLAVTSLELEPERANPGNEVIVSATIGNVANGDAGAAELVFMVGDEEIGRESIDVLKPGE